MSRLVNQSVLLLLVLVCLLGAASAKPHEELTKDHVTELANECKAETGASDEDVKQMMDHEAAEGHEGKCLRACVMKKFQIMDESGKLNKEHAVEMIKAMSKHDAEKEDAPAEVVDKCEAIEAPEDHCDAAVAFESCLYEQMKEHGLELEEH
ncbi:general odorant-binding protein 19d isoform X1 [Drosophila subpulchrella]|uniref:general odorant-binding protein 19d isoform X1 n=1 Tax=Drosophila subpulchrella TaxID=1486046 RepID=UPI0018A1B52B|nr:general odorant-binding protein 19d isoform X1 [Drosophila subpulchrella]